MEHEIMDSEDFLPNSPFTGGVSNAQRAEKEAKTPEPYPLTHGRGVIRIPLSDDTLNEVTIQKYLPRILSKHAINATECNHFEHVYRGDMQILDKKRPYASEDKSNTIVVENHINYMVEFKKGYMYGNPVKYSIDDDSLITNELSYLDRYMKDRNKARKDIDMAETVFKCGNAYRMVLPRVRNLINLEKQAPFEIYNLDNRFTFVVYSSGYTKEKIMGGVITELDSVNPDQHEYEIMIYTREYIYKYKCYSLLPTWEMLDFKSKNPNPLGMIPIVEFYVNTARMGVCDLAESMNNAINNMSSDSVDAINDFVNSILVFENQIVDKETKTAMDELGAILLQTNDPSKPAKAYYLVNQLQQADVLTKYETMIKWMYNIVGVPQPTQKSTSGGDTGEARELGGGWENANTVANQHEEPLKDGDMRVLAIVLRICSMTPNCPVKTLFPSDIEINFNRTRSNNILTKTQSLQTLISMNMPKEIALNIVGITGNSHEVAEAWEAEVEKSKQEAMELAQKQQESQKSDDTKNEEE